MPPTCVSCRAAAPSAAQANEAIRAFVAGRRSWTRADLAELARLRGEWLAARQREQWSAAA